MCTSESEMNKLLLASVALLLLSGCPGEATWEYPIDLSEVRYVLFDDTEGVYPSTAVADSPHNPFAAGGVDDVTKWEIEASGAAAAAFYSWAMVNLRGAHGEAQYYTALNLQRIYQRGLTDDQDLYTVRLMAIDAYQAVLDHWPNDVTYAEGGWTLSLALLAYDGIVSLGAAPQGGWVRITDSDGNPAVIKTNAT